jgi:hypothetical protein
LRGGRILREISLLDKKGNKRRDKTGSSCDISLGISMSCDDVIFGSIAAILQH